MLEFSSRDKDLVSDGGKRHLREIRKTAVLSLLDTLAKAFEGGGQRKNREGFVRLVEGLASWQDAKRVSVVHLAKALQIHFQIKPEDSWVWVELYTFLKEKHGWIDGKYGCENYVSVDPMEEDMLAHWPRNDGGTCCKLFINANGKVVSLRDFRHSYLLYSYRNCLVHESREPNVSYENDRDKQPLYMTVGGENSNYEYHLVYPLQFLIDLTNNCIKNIRGNVGCNPYPNFSYGPYIIPELNTRTKDWSSC